MRYEFRGKTLQDAVSSCVQCKNAATCYVLEKEYQSLALALLR